VNDWLQAHGTPAAEAQQLADGSMSVAKGAGNLPIMETYRPGDHVAIGEYDFDVVWTPGHTPGHVCFMDHQKETDIQLRARQLWKHHMDRQGQVREILGGETLTAYELGSHVWAETKPNRWSDLHGHLLRNAIGTLVAHAEMLRDRGVLDRTANPPYRYGRA